ncbi:MAG TPA: hypothetical protein VG166_07695 [Caulobacteraceae bacterium]|jgi:hypothetical protein|nr:hypothetical protein [Caulobacteraceae bacterium]
MHQSGAIAAAVLVAAAAGPAAASPAFEAFRQVCADSHADFAAAKTALATGAWRPAEVHAATMQGVTVAESVTRAEAAGPVKLTAFAWHGTKGAVQISACTVRISPMPLPAIAKEARDWAGFEPQVATPSQDVWRYTSAGSAHTSLQPPEYNAAAAGAGLEFFTVSADGADTVLDLLKIKS